MHKDCLNYRLPLVLVASPMSEAEWGSDFITQELTTEKTHSPLNSQLRFDTKEEEDSITQHTQERSPAGEVRCIPESQVKTVVTALEFCETVLETVTPVKLVPSLVPKLREHVSNTVQSQTVTVTGIVREFYLNRKYGFIYVFYHQSYGLKRSSVFHQTNVEILSRNGILCVGDVVTFEIVRRWGRLHANKVHLAPLSLRIEVIQMYDPSGWRWCSATLGQIVTIYRDTVMLNPGETLKTGDAVEYDCLETERQELLAFNIRLQ